MSKLRLLVTQRCDRACPGCCNKDWDLDSLPVCQSFEGYDEIILTGGEPMLIPVFVSDLIDKIRKQTDTPIYMYTADVRFIFGVQVLLTKYLDGITLTLHEQEDVIDFQKFNQELSDEVVSEKSLRLNVFDGVDLTGVNVTGWTVKPNIKWIKDCPLPTDEVFMRI